MVALIVNLNPGVCSPHIPNSPGIPGRRDYPAIGGCYYASRLAVLEALRSIRRLAAVITWREIYEGFDLPVGVWDVGKWKSFVESRL